MSKRARKQAKLRGKQRTRETDGPEISDGLDSASSSNQPSAVNKALQKLSGDEAQRKVNEIVQYLSIASQKKYPIKRGDINKHVLKEHSKAFPKLIKLAERNLESAFGIKLLELESKKSCYILINAFENQRHLKLKDEEYARHGLLMTILSFLFMQESPVAESILWQFLKKLGVKESDKNHPVFGDVRKLVTQEFTRELYLNFERIQGTDPPQNEVSWGERAQHELKMRDCLDFVCKMYGEGFVPQNWTSQYQRILQSEEEENGTA